MVARVAAHVGRADLLRLLADTDRATLTLDDDGATWFGYILRDAPTPAPVEITVPPLLPPPPEPAVIQPTHRAKPLQMPFVKAVVQREALESPLEDESWHVAEPITPPEAESRTQGRLQVGFEDLIPKARLLPMLRRALAATRHGGLDVPRLVQCLASGELPRQLPRQHWLRWHPDLVVVLDFSVRLWPYREDMHRLAEQLLRLCGRSAVSLRILNDGPAGRWCDWVAEQRVTTSGRYLAWAMPLAGTPVLIVSDCGRLLPRTAPERQHWQGFLAELLAAGTRPLALTPLGARQLDTALAQRLPVLRWSPDANRRRERGSLDPNPQPEGMDALLAMVATTRRVDPPLLRELRRLNPHAPGNAGLEGALWCHEHVDAGIAACIRGPHQQRYLKHFARDLRALHLHLQQLRLQHHAHLRRALEHEEVLLWAAYAEEGAVHAATEQIKDAKRFMGKIPRTVGDAAASPEERQRWRQVAEGIIARAEVAPAMLEQYGDVLQPLKEVAIGYGGEHQATLQCWIVVDVCSGEVRLQAQLGGVQQFVLNDALSIDARGLIVRVSTSENDVDGSERAYTVGTVDGTVDDPVDGYVDSSDSHYHVRLVSRGELPLVIARVNSRETVQLETSHELVRLGPILRQRGVQRWWCDEDGVQMRGPTLCGREVRFTSHWPTRSVPQGLSADETGGVEPNRDWRPVQPRPAEGGVIRGWCLMSGVRHPLTPLQHGRPFFGFDDFGLYADLFIQGRHGSATQRFRFIEPGTFQMGSLQDEPERYENEGPQHPVTLTQGFWLADTACTQALWSAVMGSNPSSFKGDELPVETVSWHDVQKFLRELDALLPNFRADLPTEAEWEYACRAGTTRPFSFGENITPAQVNYDGNYPYAEGEKGEYREYTVPVKSLPGNPWGLYEMHGNVWEWCADGLREYGNTAVADPVGMLEDVSALRALRGGSWIDYGRGVRSASRNADGPGYRDGYIGFRLCSRSSQSSPVPTRPGEPGLSARGARLGASPEPPTGARRKNSRGKGRSPSKSGSKK